LTVTEYKREAELLDEVCVESVCREPPPGKGIEFGGTFLRGRTEEDGSAI
jgi:hypothetical protein